MTEKTAKAPSMKLNKKAAATPAETEAAAPTETVTTAAPKTGLKKKVAAAAVEAVAPVETETVGTTETQNITADDEIVVIAKEIETVKEDKAFKLIASLMEDSDRNQFRIGGLLSRVQAEGWFQDKGFETFKDFVEASYGMKYRKAMYLIEIYNSLVAAQIPWEKVSHLGWTKLVEVIKHLTLENVDEWLAEIDGLTVDQIKALVTSKTKGVAAGLAGTTAKEEAQKTTSMTFKLHEDQKATVREALDKCKHETGTEFDNVALEHICLEFLGGESAVKAIPTLKELMETKSAEEVLTLFGEIFPDVAIEATIPG